MMNRMGSAVLSTLLVFTLALMTTPVVNADNARLLDLGAASKEQLQQLARDHETRIEALERRHSEQLEALEYELDLLRQRIAKIEKARDLEDRQRARESFNKRRTLNWPKVNTGMSRREIYRLIGSGTKDRSETERDCRCFSQGRVCFNSDDIATKSNIRCQL